MPSPGTDTTAAVVPNRFVTFCEQCSQMAEFTRTRMYRERARNSSHVMRGSGLPPSRIGVLRMWPHRSSSSDSVSCKYARTRRFCFSIIDMVISILSTKRVDIIMRKDIPSNAHACIYNRQDGERVRLRRAKPHAHTTIYIVLRTHHIYGADFFFRMLFGYRLSYHV